MLGLRPAQVLDQVVRAHEVDAVPGFDGGQAEGDRQVGLADARRPEQDDVGRLGDERQRRQLPHLPLVQRRLEGEVELVEGALEGQVRQAGAGAQVALAAGGHLNGEQFGQYLGVGQVVVGRLVELVLEHRCGVRELQLLEVGAGLGQGEHHRPSSASAA